MAAGHGEESHSGLKGSRATAVILTDEDAILATLRDDRFAARPEKRNRLLSVFPVQRDDYVKCGSSSSEMSCRYSSLAGNSLGRFKLASPT